MNKKKIKKFIRKEIAKQLHSKQIIIILVNEKSFDELFISCFKVKPLSDKIETISNPSPQISRPSRIADMMKYNQEVLDSQD